MAAMESYEPTSLLLSKIRTFDPENASKILGFLLLNGVPEKDLMRLVLGPDTVLQNLIFKAKSQLGLLSNTSCAPISRPNLTIPSPTANNGGHHFPHSSPRIVPDGDSRFDFPRNPSSPSSGSPWSGSGFPSNSPISPRASSLLSFDSIRSGSAPAQPFSGHNNGDCAGEVSRTNSGDLIDENQLSEYLSFLNDSSKHDDLVDPRDDSGYGSNTHLHKRSYSASDACFGSEDGGFVAGGGFRPCVYFARGFCKNGSNCKFVHGGFPENFDGFGSIAGSPNKFDGFEQREEIMRLKAAEQQRLAAMSQFGPRAMSPYNKYMNLLLQQQSDPQRSAAAAALMMQEELHRFGRLRAERNDFMMMGLADKCNSASRQIYLTFPAESNFKDEDVSEYFGNYGPVQDVRIPYQQKRMFGFVTFVFPETVKLILARGNPHFICESRVLVKPYKEKGKVPERRQHLQHQQLDRGDFSGCLSPSEMDDLHLGSNNFYSAQEMMLRRKLEEADLQQAIELQGRRLVNLHLPEFKDDHIRHHQRSFSVGAAAASFPVQPHSQVNHDVTEGNQDFPAAVAATQLQVNQETDTALVQNNGGSNSKENSSPSGNDDHNSALGGSPIKSVGDGSSFSTELTNTEESNATPTNTPENGVSLPASSASDVASR